MTDHDGNLLALHDGIYTTGYSGACACGWTGDPHDSRGAALLDLLAHLRTAKD